MAEKARQYLASKNIRGFPEEALTFIGAELEKFEETDTDGSGKLSLEEIQKMLEKDYGCEWMGGCTPAATTDLDAKELLELLDLDITGDISREEWIRKIILKWAKYTYLRPLAQYDTDRSELIPQENLIEVLVKEGYDQHQLNQFIDENDLSQSGKINFKNFLDSFFDVARK